VHDAFVNQENVKYFLLLLLLLFSKYLMFFPEFYVTLDLIVRRIFRGIVIMFTLRYKVQKLLNVSSKERKKKNSFSRNRIMGDNYTTSDFLVFWNERFSPFFVLLETIIEPARGFLGGKEKQRKIIK
jgi:hypothetical protein